MSWYTQGLQDIGAMIDDGLVVREAKPVQPAGTQEPEWEAPIAFNQERLPEFPVDCLPGVLRDYVFAVAEAVQVPPDMAAVAGLSVCALCVQGKFRIQGKADWYEPLNLYTAIVALPGERKSAVCGLMAAPVLRFEEEHNEAIRPRLEEHKTRCTVLTKRIKALEELASKPSTKAKPIGDEEALRRIFDKQKELAELEKDAPEELRLWTDDATPEATASLMAAQGGRLSVISAEGGIFDMLDGRYSGGVNVDLHLKAHAGDTVRVDRKGRPPEYIEAPALTMLLFVQPQILEGLMGNSVFRGRGLVGRFLYSIPVSKVGARVYDTVPIPETVKVGYDDLIRGLLSIQEPWGDSIIRLSAEAEGLSRVFACELEPRLAGDLEGMADWAGKLHGAVLRVAGVTHCIEHGEKSSDAEVSRDTMQSAIMIGRYFLEHAQAAFRLMGLDKTSADAQYILRQFEKGRYTEITRTELNRLCRGRFQQVEAMEAGVNELIERGFVREKRNPLGYRNRTQMVYEINPKAYAIDSIDSIHSLSMESFPSMAGDIKPEKRFVWEEKP